ncbi:MAG: nucleotide exchange factor GrpE [Clostridiales bacterium]|nr:nucleotide exchange factor GrpE [Clostridiales bacterium]
MKKDDKKNDIIDESEVIDEEAQNECEECSQTGEKPEDARVAALEIKCNEYLDMAQRIKADFENYKKRNKNAVTEAYDDGTNETAILLLPVLDNLERAMAAMSGYENDSVIRGVELVFNQIKDVFTKLGIVEIPTDCPFNPNFHNAVMQEECSEGVEENTITLVLQKGYMRGDKVLRFAMVKVAV